MRSRLTDPEAVQQTYRVHVVGASGSGTSTLGRRLADDWRWSYLDTDAFYWMPTDPPFREKRAIPDRIALLSAEMARDTNWVLAGSLVRWGDVLVPQFTDVVFLTLDPVIRLARLKAREVAQFSAARLAPSGDLHDAHEAFMAWAALYDKRGHVERRRALHEDWLSRLPPHIRIHRLDSSEPVEELLRLCRRTLAV